jgi:hypothetical protein
MMALTDYSIDTSGSPQDVQRKQALADALMKQGMDSTPAAGGKGGGWVTALNRGLAGALGGYQRGAAANEEQQGRDSVRQQLAAALQGGGNISPQTMIGLASNPWATPGQTQAVTHVADMQAQKARQGVEDQHWQATFGLQKEAAGRAAQSAERANMTPAEIAKEREDAARAYGLDPTTPQGRAYTLTGKMPEGDTSIAQAVEQRKQAATNLGLDPSHPGYNSFILTGKMPREDAQPLTATDKKAILDAEEKLQSSKATITNLQQAKKLSPQAMQGPGASTRGYMSSFLGGSSDLGKAGIATQDLENLTTANALQSLKSVFGGNPTEGERAILLDIQGSVGKPDVVRQKIYDRAIEAANRRMAFEQQHIDELRGGTFYKPQGGLSKGAGEPATAAPDPLGIR